MRESPVHKKCSIGRRAVLCVSVLIACLSGAAGCQRKNQPADATNDARSAEKLVELAAEDQPAVELVIDYGDGVEKRFTRIPHDKGMTVLGALRFAAQHRRGVTFEKTGSGAAALLTKIDDLSNEASRDGRNWIYRVNGKLATKSFDAYTLSPNDVILWKFETYE